MGFNRGPLYGNGLLLAGDSAGMISPFNGEGIAYGLQAGRVAADAIAQGLARGTPPGRERSIRRVPATGMKNALRHFMHVAVGDGLRRAPAGDPASERERRTRACSS